MQRLFPSSRFFALLLPGVLTTAAPPRLRRQDPKMTPMSDLPQEMQSAPTQVSEAYRFALANPDVLKKDSLLLRLRRDGTHEQLFCYVKDIDSKGKAIFDQHALGCSLCVDITQDVLRLTKEGKSPGDIHSFVVSTYSQYGRRINRDNEQIGNCSLIYCH